MQRLGGLLSNVRSIAELLAYQGRQDSPPFASMLPHHYCKLLRLLKVHASGITLSTDIGKHRILCVCVCVCVCVCLSVCVCVCVSVCEATVIAIGIYSGD